METCKGFVRRLEMNFKIVTDSSSNIFEISDVPFECVPMKIISQSKEYVDVSDLDVENMVLELKKQTASTSSSCPNIKEWLDAFGNADGIFGVTITSKLSGSYSSAISAKDEYIKLNEDAKVCIIDSLSTGPEMQLLIEKLRERILAGESFDVIERKIKKYHEHTHLMFYLKSLDNLAKNGRVNATIAKLVGILGICFVGKAGDGVLVQTHKCRGEVKTIKALYEDMKKTGYNGGKVRISHCMNLKGAELLKGWITDEFPNSDIQIGECKGLCSYYAEMGGILVGFEDSI